MSSTNLQDALKSMKQPPSARRQRASGERKARTQKTVYEHLTQLQTFPDMEDEQFYYTGLPASDGKRLARFVRTGYELAPDHANNATDLKILRIPREIKDTRYKRVADYQRHIIGEPPPIGDKRDVPINSVTQRAPETMGEILERMPAGPPEDADDDGDENDG